MANKNLSATITIGGAVSGALMGAIGKTKTQLLEVGGAIKQIQREQRMLSEGINTFGRMGKNVDSLRERYAATTKEVERLRRAQASLQAIETAKQSNLSRRADIRGSILDTVALGATVSAPIVQAAQFEKAMLGVAKQVDGARDKAGNLTAVYHDMARQIQLLGREIPLATNEIADMVAAGARMGVARDALIDFTRTSAMMASAFELPAGELAEQMGKIATLFKIPIPAIGELADTINYLDDNAISKGGDIIDVLKRIGGTAQMVKMASKEAAALASTFLTLGSSAEVSATAANAVMRELSIATMQPKRFQAGLAALKIDAKRLQADMAKDATGTILKVLDKINAIPQEKRLTVATQLFGKEYGDDVSKLAEGVEEYRRQLTLATGNKAFAEGIKDAEKLKDALDKAGGAAGSMKREFDAQRATALAQFQLLKNQITEVSVVIGSVLLPQVNATVSAITPMVNGFAEFSREHPMVTKAIFGTVQALVALRVASLAGAYAMTFVRGAGLAVAGVLAGARGQAALTAVALRTVGAAGVTAQGGLIGVATTVATRLAPAFAALGAVIAATPIGWLIAGAAAIAAGGALIYKYWEPLKAFFGGFFTGLAEGMAPIADGFKAAFSPVWEVIAPMVMPVLETVGGWVKSAVGWFGELLTPIDKAAQTTVAFGEAGKVCGEVVGQAFTVMLTPIRLVLDSLKWIHANIGGIIDNVGKATSAAKNAVGGAWSSTKDGVASGWNKAKDFIGLGDSEQKPAPQAAAPVLAGRALPPMATSRAAAPTMNDQRQYNINVTAQPGQDTRAVAREVMREIDRQQGVRNRSLMFDPVTP